jgi:four helix bundle protein
MVHNYRELRVWQYSIRLAHATYDLTDGFPNAEKYGLVSQMRRASVSIATNIAEGCSRRTARDFRRFVDIALGSAFELDTHIAIAKHRHFGESTAYKPVEIGLSDICSMLVGLRQAATDQR